MATRVRATESSHRRVPKNPVESPPGMRIDASRYRQLVELSPVPIAVHDRGVVKYVNRAGVDLIGARDANELLGRNVLEFLHPQFHEEIIRRIASLSHADLGLASTLRVKLITLSSEIIDAEIDILNFEYDGSLATQMVLKVISRRTPARTALVESIENFRQLADSMPQMVWISGPDGKTLYRNSKWFEYFGLRREDELTTDWYRTIHPSDRAKAKTAWMGAIQSGEPFETEFRLKASAKSASYRWFLSRAMPVKDSQGNVIKWFGTTTDIDDLRRTKQRKKELEKIAEALTKQQRELVALNHAKDEFISLASHQLRTPATGVKQYIGMALEGYAGELSPKQEYFLQQAYDSNERQLAIVDDLLHIAQIDAGRISLDIDEVDLVELVSQSVGDLAGRFTARKQKVTFAAKRQIAAPADKSRLRMVLDNILDNASKYTSEGKSITITVRTSRTSVHIAIHDEGVGIAARHRDKIFEKFSRIDNPLSVQAGGSGLGLYWAQKIINLHGGKITVDSKLGSGTTFAITLPRQPIS